MQNKQNKIVTPELLKKIRKKIGLTQKEAGESVNTSMRVWQRYEAPTSATSSARIPETTAELFCLKHGLPYPPVQNAKLSKLITVLGGSGSGCSLLAMDLAILLMQDDYDVLILTDEYQASGIYSNKSIDENLPFPKVKNLKGIESRAIDGPFAEISEVIKGNETSLNDIVPLYDFCIMDVNDEIAKRELAKRSPDLILTPVLMRDHTARLLKGIEKTFTILSESLPADTKSIYKICMLGVKQPYSDNFEQSYLNGESVEDCEASINWCTKDQEAKLMKLKSVCGNNILDSFTSAAYQGYVTKTQSEKGYSIVHKHPNSFAVFELNSIKNEILKILRVKA